MTSDQRTRDAWSSEPRSAPTAAPAPRPPEPCTPDCAAIRVARRPAARPSQGSDGPYTAGLATCAGLRRATEARLAWYGARSLFQRECD